MNLPCEKGKIDCMDLDPPYINITFENWSGYIQ